MIVVKKGYTITVVSWENDGDDYKTLSKTVDSREKAKAYYDLMQLCESENNQPDGVIRLGNSTDDFSEEQEQLIIDFFKENPILVEGSKINNYIELFNEISSDLLGYSEWYTCRVMESCTITYSDHDVYTDEVIF